MELWILDNNFTDIGIVDSFKSFIWTQRYTKVGDCEIYIAASAEMVELLQKGHYIYRTDCDMICRIESIEIDTNTETGNFLIVKGYDCKKILGQRIIWNVTTFNGTAENFIRKIITENIIYASPMARRIKKFVLADEHGFTETIDIQTTYDSLLEKIQSVCDTFGYGFRVTFDSENLVFDLYKGVDRSVNQTEREYVLFSPDFENLISTKYTMDATNVATDILVAGEGDGKSRKTATYPSTPTYSGLNRYERFVDARDISSDAEGEEPISPLDYRNLLRGRGAEKFAEYGIVTTFEGEVEPNQSFVFNVDYFLGDIVTVRNEFGIEVDARVTEVIEAYDDNGYTIIPKFEFMEVQQ